MGSLIEVCPHGVRALHCAECTEGTPLTQPEKAAGPICRMSDRQQADEYRALLFALWERNGEFAWHDYAPSFAAFLRDLECWANAEPG
jgi:hypothetical protein